jgi:O-antigen/teichoic acid export membrane protein
MPIATSVATQMDLTKFGKNTLLYMIGTVGLRTASFVLIPIYTYSVAMNEYGLLAVLLQTAQIMVTVMNLGSRTALVRFAKEYEDKDQIGILLGTSIFINILGAFAVTVIAMSVLSPLFRSVLHVADVSGYVLLTCAGAAFNCLSVHLVSYYRAGQDGLKVTCANLASAVSMILLTLVFLRMMHLGIYGALLAQAIIYGALSAFLLVVLSSRVRLGLSFPLIRDLVRFGLPLILVMTGGLITQTCTLYFLSYFRGLADVGIYSIGLKLAQAAEMILILPFVMAYEPFVYSHAGDSRLWSMISRLFTYLMIAFVFTACGIVFFARDLMPLVAPPEYGSAYSVIFLLLPAVAFRGVYYIGESLLFLEKKTQLAGTIVTSVSLTGILLSYVLISHWGMYGAIAVYLFTTVCTGVIALKQGLGMSGVRLETERLWVTALFLFTFLFLEYALRNASGYLYYSLVPACACGGALFLYATRFVKEEERRVVQQFLGRAQRLRSGFNV